MNVSLIAIVTGLIIFIIICAILKYFVLFGIGVALLGAVSLFSSKIENFGYYKFDDPKLEDLRKRIESVIPEINKVSLHGSNKSFTINKSASYICTKDKEDEYYSDNMLIYVILHELAHAISPTVESPKGRHSKAWENIFNGLLARAEKGGIYDSKIPILKDYCEY